jgi:hypothetical protein
LTLAHKRLFTPKWSENVLEEAQRNRPDGVPAERVQARFDRMREVFPAAMTSGFEGLEDQMQADAKDKHVLAAAVHSKSTVLVTENIKDFQPPSSGPNAMKVEKTSDFLNRLLAENRDRVVAAMESMVQRNRHEPRNMPELIDIMATRGELEGFAHKLNQELPEDKRGSHPNLQTSQSMKAAMEGLPSAGHAASKPVNTPEARKAEHGQAKGTDLEKK